MNFVPQRAILFMKFWRTFYFKKIIKKQLKLKFKS